MSDSKKAGKVGRPPEPLKVEGNWKDAIKHALTRGKPAKPAKQSAKKRS